MRIHWTIGVAGASLMVLLLMLPALAQRDPGRGEKYALLVGVRRYDPNQLRSLLYSEPDVVDLAATLKAQGYKPGNVILMTQTTGAEDPRFAPEAAKIRKELTLLLEGMEEEDSVMVALAGHGVQFRGEAENYFCPSDARLDDRRTLIPLGEVYKELEACKAGLKLLLVDACRNDPQSDNSRSRSVVNLESVTRPQRVLPPGGVVAFFSCSEGERAFEHSDLKHGVFFHFVIEALRGNAAGSGETEVLIPDLEKYVKRNVRDYVRDKYGERQRPEMRGTSRDLVPLVRLKTGQTPERHLGPRRNLYVLAVGISSYVLKDLNLRFAHKDATDFASVWQSQEGVFYSNVETRVLTDANATKSNILAGMDWLARSASDQDVSIVFVSSHGMRDSSGEYFLGTQEIDPDRLQATGIRVAEFARKVAILPGQVLVFTDTFRTGGLGAKLVGDPLRVLVSDEVGAMLFASSTPREESLEYPNLKNGAFSKAILDTLQDSASDLDKDGKLTITELDFWIDNRVQKFTRGQQHPTTHRPHTISNFAIYKFTMPAVPFSGSPPGGTP
ncbi:caspase family protein [Singulisphaera sp. Ch08]|uniref:Caspase family protein n=1 Tax=Singulisphaera sp. Ch08 TaxID=3120278 RepID=A0AAU7CHE5_9BACT